MNHFQDLRGIFITSSGRTGTHFLGAIMSKMIKNCISVHEPDVLQIDKPKLWFKKICKYGPVKIVLGRFFKQYSPRSLGNSRIKKEISDKKAINILKNLRKKEISKIKDKIYLEANCQLIGLVDILPKVFSNSNVIVIIRDPRDWIRSWMNKPNTYYSIKDVRNWFRGRLSAKSIKFNKYSKEWKNMDIFEKLCWAWNCENLYAFECSKTSNNIKFFRYEDLFIKETKEKYFKKMLNFITTFPDGYKEDWNYHDHFFEKKYDSSSGSFPHWKKWDRRKSLTLYKHCKYMMEVFNYGKESNWKEKINK